VRLESLQICEHAWLASLGVALHEVAFCVQRSLQSAADTCEEPEEPEEPPPVEDDAGFELDEQAEMPRMPERRAAASQRCMRTSDADSGQRRTSVPTFFKKG
jgi:hypothetical protein